MSTAYSSLLFKMLKIRFQDGQGGHPRGNEVGFITKIYTTEPVRPTIEKKWTQEATLRLRVLPATAPHPHARRLRPVDMTTKSHLGQLSTRYSTKSRKISRGSAPKTSSRIVPSGSSVMRKSPEAWQQFSRQNPKATFGLSRTTQNLHVNVYLIDNLRLIGATEPLVHLPTIKE